MVLRAGQALLGVRHQVGGVVGAVSPPGHSRQVRDDGLDQAGVGDYRDQRRLRPLAALKQPVGDVRAGPQYGASRVDNVRKGRGRPLKETKL